jgi:predicted RNase H-like nuclease/L-amino acid N-acyltransferase YncA
MATSAAVTGFDSAWSRKNRGAVAHIVAGNGAMQFIEPRTASFEEALASINEVGKNANVHIVGIDQPLIVPNQAGCRPVERAFQPLLSSVRGAIQPANRGKSDLFGDDAPIWTFLGALNADVDWSHAIGAASGRYAIEIYPAAALLGLLPHFLGRKLAAKYNPTNQTFNLADWRLVCDSLASLAAELEIVGLPDWASAHGQISKPRKPDQDCLDAVICAVVTYLWWRYGFERSIVVGDLRTGYIVTPSNPAMTKRLADRAVEPSVPVHVTGLERDTTAVNRASLGINIREAVPDDAEAIAAIYNQGIEDRVATLETQLRTADERAQWLAAKGPRHPVLVALDGEGSVVGWGSLNQFNPRPAYDHVVEFSVYVGREQRGQGIGSVLLSALEDRARSLGFHKMVLAAFPWNAGGMRLYQKHGFATVGTFHEQGRLDDRWVDVILMEKILG